MFARVSLPTLTGSGRHTLDAPVAALAGLSVAFLAFAMPADLLSELVDATGLSSIIPAAVPPLGVKARIGLGGAGAIVVFAVAFLVLRWLDRFGAPRREPEEVTGDLEPPRLRRRDIHPDAPARAPLLANYHLGEPAPPQRPIEPAAEPEPSPAVAFDPPPLPPVGRQSFPDPDAASVAEAIDLAADDPAPLDLSVRGHSVSELMARLEQGLARRRTTVAPVDPMIDAPAPDASDQRLQSAIENLQRLASRHS